MDLKLSLAMLLCIFSLTRADIKDQIREEITKSKHKIYVEDTGERWNPKIRYYYKISPHNTENWHNLESQRRPVKEVYEYHGEKGQSWNNEKKGKYEYDTNRDKDNYDDGNYEHNRYESPSRYQERPWNKNKYENSKNYYDNAHSKHVNDQNPVKSYENYDKDDGKWSKYQQDDREHDYADKSKYEYDYKPNDNQNGDYGSSNNQNGAYSSSNNQNEAYTPDHNQNGDYSSGPDQNDAYRSNNAQNDAYSSSNTQNGDYSSDPNQNDAYSSDHSQNDAYSSNNSQKNDYTPNVEQKHHYRYYFDRDNSNYKNQNQENDHNNQDNSPSISTDNKQHKQQEYVLVKQNEKGVKEDNKAYGNVKVENPVSHEQTPEVQKIYVLEGQDVVASGNHPSKLQGHYGLPTDMKWWHGWAQGWQTAVRNG